jgi:hypothetical protein
MPQSTLRHQFIQLLPAYSLTVFLSLVPGWLERYVWFSDSPTTNLYIWTTIWTVAFLAVMAFQIRQGPLLVACTGTIRNLHMLWQMYELLGQEVYVWGSGLGGLVGALILTAVAGRTCLYFVGQSPISEPNVEDGDWVGKGIEKA